jgi:hypothetical protein
LFWDCSRDAVASGRELRKTKSAVLRATGEHLEPGRGANRVQPDLLVAAGSRGPLVVTVNHQQIDVVKVLATTKTVRQIVARIQGGAQFAATGTLKAEVTIALLRDRTVSAKPHDRQFHRQLVANRSQ